MADEAAAAAAPKSQHAVSIVLSHMSKAQEFDAIEARLAVCLRSQLQQPRDCCRLSAAAPPPSLHESHAARARRDRRLGLAGSGAGV